MPWLLHQGAPRRAWSGAGSVQEMTEWDETLVQKRNN